MTAWAFRAAIASWHLRVSYAPSTVTLPSSCSGGIWLSRSGSVGASIAQQAIARISSVFSSIPICILRRGRRLGPPVARQGIAPQYLRGDQQVQWFCRTFVRDSDGHRFLTAAKGAKIRCCPVQANKLEKACNKSRRLPQRQTEQYFEGQAGLYRRIAVGLLTSPSP